MKKLITSCATIALLSGSIASVTAWTNVQHSATKITQSSQRATDKLKENNYTAIQNETAADIANKLRGKIIKLDPTVWLGRNIQNYFSDLNALVIKAGILTADEAKHVAWSSQTIASAAWYWTVHFIVDFSGQTASGTDTLNATTGETTAQIANKLKTHLVKLNYNYWNGKNLATNLAQLRSIIVNEGILTKAEASDITGLYNGTGKSDFYTVGPGWINVPNVINYTVNDNNTVSQTPDYNGIDVLSDGEDAQQLASKVTTSDFIIIPTQYDYTYADAPQTLAGIRQEFVTEGYYNSDQTKYLYAPHQQLRDLPFGQSNHVVFTFQKDGQFVNTVPFRVVVQPY